MTRADVPKVTEGPNAMRHVNSKFTLATAVLAVAGVSALSTVAHAQQQGQQERTRPASQPKPERLTSVEARKALSEGRAALEARQTDLAIGRISAAIDSRRLNSKEMAQALYRRGLAHRAKGDTPRAIEDLTAALWIKGGLSEPERQDALRERAASYEAAGVPAQSVAQPADQSPTGTERAAIVASPPAPASTSSPVANRQAAPPPAAPVRTPPSWQTTTRGDGAARTPRVASPDVDPDQRFPQLPQSPTVSGSTAAEAAEQPVTGTIASFFSGLFAQAPGSAPEPPDAALAPETTASVRPPEPSRPRADTGSTNVALSSWTTAETTRPASVGVPPAPLNALRVQVKAVRDEQEAQAIASTVNRSLAAELSGRTASVRPVVMGNMGRMYRVEVGPFASARETAPLCQKLRQQGLDCLPLAN